MLRIWHYSLKNTHTHTHEADGMQIRSCSEDIDDVSHNETLD